MLFPDGTSATATMNTPRAHSRELLPMIQQLMQDNHLAWQDIGAFAVGVGPGSFTGLRVACATIAGINASLKKPAYPLCSLEITARQSNTTEPIWAIEDARSKLVYAAKYQQGQLIEPAQCLAWDDFLRFDVSSYISVSDVPVEMTGWQPLAAVVPREQALVEATKAIQPDDEHSFWLEPVYLQVSQAEKNIA
ncbi:MAG: tRNA (adenosine(37)-N6)-threonylcarbamoyltransferase complex dimerization subunit type 1 TsaB [Ghiorsea sp.]